ncbi:hypothetical protein [Undibacterium sp. TJN19]|uniref:hypothetical protein n=1 Tax=Undibacterium sp. TJN19 TaxID=3413055 RepID=UPI003BF24E8C
MTTSTKFQVRDSNGTLSTEDSLRDAVLAAASHDMFGARFERMNDEGEIHPSHPMRFFSSRRHIGNNVYSIDPIKDNFNAESNLADDDAAERDVAEQVKKQGYLHSKHTIEIVELTFEDDVLTHVDGLTVEEILADIGDEDDTVELIRSIYE